MVRFVILAHRQWLPTSRTLLLTLPDVVTDLLVLTQPATIFPGYHEAGAAVDDENDEETVLPRETGLLATASLDRTICLWRLPKCECSTKLVGHRAGVRSLSYDTAQRLLFSAGFEFGVRAWGVSGDQAVPIFVLEGGHFASVNAVAAAPGAGHCVVTLDDSGRMCWWNASRDAACSGEERLCQTFELQNDKSMFVAPCGFGIDLSAISERRAGELPHGMPPSTVRLPQDASAIPGERSHHVTHKAHLAAAALNWSTNAVSLVCGGRRGELHVYDASEARPPECPPTLLAYSSITHEIVSIHGNSVKLWDARSGILCREHTAVTTTGASVAGYAFDARGLRFLLADRSGCVTTHRVYDGSLLSSWTPHQAEIGALQYSPEDRVVVTASWDRAIHVYDESENNPRDALLRRVENAHESDIVGLDVSRDLGLVATAAADGAIRLWDFEDLQLSGAVLAHDGTSLPLSSAIVFVRLHPVLVVADANGNVSVVVIRTGTATFSRQCHVAFSFPNLASLARSDNFSQPCSGGSVVQCMYSSVDVSESEPPTVSIYTADALGHVCAFDVSSMLDAIKVTTIPGDKLRWCTKGYNARRRLYRDHALSSFGTDHSSVSTTVDDRDLEACPMLSEEDRARLCKLVRVVSWRAHNDAVTCLLLTSEPRRLLTASADGSIRCWDADGGARGALTLGREGDAQKLRTTAVSSKLPQRTSMGETDEDWDFLSHAEIDKQRRRGYHRAKAIVARIVASKRSERQRAAEATELARAKEATSRAVQGGSNKGGELDLLSYVSTENHQDQRSRLFGQLDGKMTWELSEMEKAREVAAKQAQDRNKPPRHRKKKGRQSNRIDEDENSIMQSVSGSSVTTTSESELARRAQEEDIRKEVRRNEFRQDPNDPTNWSVGSTNRQKSMYPNLHEEFATRRVTTTNRSRNAVKPPGSLAHENEALRLMIEPSAFLKEQLRITKTRDSLPKQTRLKRSKGRLAAEKGDKTGLKGGHETIVCCEQPPHLPVAAYAAAPASVHADRSTLLARSSSAPSGLRVVEGPIADSPTQRASSPTMGNKGRLPPLADKNELALSAKRKVEAWQQRVHRFAQLFSDESSPRGYVFRVRQPLLSRSKDRLYEAQQRDRQATRMSPLPDAARGVASTSAPLMGRMRSEYGPSGCYPTASISDLALVYRSALCDGQDFGGPARVSTIIQHRVVVENAYFRKQAAILATRLGSSNQTAVISFRELLQSFFPLLKSPEVRELGQRYLAREDMIADKTSKEYGHGAELRMLFDLFDIHQEGRIVLADFQHALIEGCTAVRGNENWPALQESLNRQIANLCKPVYSKDGPVKITFEEFQRIILNTILSRDEVDDGSGELADPIPGQ